MIRINKSLALLILAAAFLLSFSSPAFGWGNTWLGMSIESLVNSARWRWGLMRIYGAFVLNDAGYDSDIYYGYSGEEVPDLSFSTGPIVRVFLPISKKVIFDVSESPDYVFYLDTKRERAWNNRFRGQVHFAFGRTYFLAGGGLSNVKQRLSSELFINIRRKENDINGMFFWQLTRHSALALRYTGSWLDYGEAAYGTSNLAESLNRAQNRLDLTGSFEASPKIRVYLAGGYGSYVFEAPVSRFKDTRSYGVYGGLEFVPPAGLEAGRRTVEGGISLGYTYFDVLQTGLKDGSGFTGDTDVRINLDPLTSIRAFFSRGFNFSVFSGLSYYLQTSYGTGLSRRLSRRASLSYNLSFSRSKYPEEDENGTPATDRVWKYSTHSLTFNIALKKNLRGTLFGTLGRRTVQGIPTERIFVGISLVYGYSAGESTMPAGTIF